MTAIPKVKITAHEIKRELRSNLERVRNGNAVKWAVFEELRLGTGFSREWGTRHFEMQLSAYKRMRKRGVEEHDGKPIGIVIEEAEERVKASRSRRDRRESRIDMFALCTWPSAKYERRAFEIKVDKQDLRNELANPDKRAPWLEVVNKFYFVMPKDLGVGVIHEIEELAPECGVMYYRPKLKPELTDCDCGNEGERDDWKHSYGCTYKDRYRAFRSGRTFDTARAPTQLPGCDPSWGLVASILRSAAR